MTSTCSVEGCDFTGEAEGSACTNMGECQEHRAEVVRRQSLAQIASNIPGMLTVQNKILGGLAVCGVVAVIIFSVVGIGFKYSYDNEIAGQNRDARLETSLSTLADQIGALTMTVQLHQQSVSNEMDNRMHRMVEKIQNGEIEILFTPPRYNPSSEDADIND